MSNRLQLKRGSGAPGNIFYAGEPIYDQSNKVLYVGDNGGTGSGAGSTVASNGTYLASLEMLYKSSSADSGAIRFYEDTDNGINYIALAAPSAVTSNVTLRLPDGAGSPNQVLKTDGSGNLSWVNQTSGFSGFGISDGTNTSNITSGDSITFNSGEGIDVLVSQNNDSLTISGEAASTTNAGISSYTTDFYFINTWQVGIATALTNKSFDANGTGNSISNLEVDDFAGSAIITAAEGVGSNNNDTSIPTTAAVKAYVDAVDVTTSLAADGATSGSVSTNQTLIVSGTANEIETSVSNQTITIGLPNDVTIGNDLTVTRDLTVSGNLRVVGASVKFETETVRVEDRLLELGLINNAAPTGLTTWDTGVAFNYFQTSAKKSGVIWLNNQFMAMLSEIAEDASDQTVANNPQINATSYAPVAAGGLYIGGIASGNEVINSSRAAVNLTFDGGSY
jgi:hypothetical protein